MGVMSNPFVTSSQLAEARALLDRLIAQHPPGHALQREFQTDPGIYQLDLERIWRRGWLFAGHTCQVRRKGDFFVFDVDSDSIIVIRGDDDRVHALHNTCRHRGMRSVKRSPATSRESSARTISGPTRETAS